MISSKDSSELENSLARSSGILALILQEFGKFAQYFSIHSLETNILYGITSTWDYSRLFIVHVRHARGIPKSERCKLCAFIRKYSRESRNCRNYRPRESRIGDQSTLVITVHRESFLSRASRHTNCTGNHTRPRSISILLYCTHSRKLNWTLNLIS